MAEYDNEFGLREKVGDFFDESNKHGGPLCRENASMLKRVRDASLGLKVIACGLGWHKWEHTRRALDGHDDALAIGLETSLYYRVQ